MSESVNRNNGRIILLLIAGLPVTMILAASWLWFFVQRGDIDLIGAIGTANNGEYSLIQPISARCNSRHRTASRSCFRTSA